MSFGNFTHADDSRPLFLIRLGALRYRLR
jgi:hypothetical protein